MWVCGACTASHADDTLLGCPVCNELRTALFQEEEVLLPEPTTYKCHTCSKRFDDISQLYSLDACSHRFCYPCIGTAVGDALSEGMGAGCPACGKDLSVRDLQDLARRYRPAPTTGAPQGNPNGIKRLMRELKSIRKIDPPVVTAAIVGDSVYEWHVEIKDFDSNSDDPDEKALAQDLAGRSVVLRVHFNPAYPTTPPYIRVIEPRFVFRTGHITLGGAICTENLTNQGWDPSMTLESVLLTIRSNMVSGKGRIDRTRSDPYGEKEAREAFARMKQTHGWK